MNQVKIYLRNRQTCTLQKEQTRLQERKPERLPRDHQRVTLAQCETLRSRKGSRKKAEMLQRYLRRALVWLIYKLNCRAKSQLLKLQEDKKTAMAHQAWI